MFSYIDLVISRFRIPSMRTLWYNWIGRLRCLICHTKERKKDGVLQRETEGLVKLVDGFHSISLLLRSLGVDYASERTTRACALCTFINIWYLMQVSARGFHE